MNTDEIITELDAVIETIDIRLSILAEHKAWLDNRKDQCRGDTEANGDYLRVHGRIGAFTACREYVQSVIDMILLDQKET